METVDYTSIPDLINSWVIVHNDKTKETERVRLSELIRLIKTVNEC